MCNVVVPLTVCNGTKYKYFKYYLKRIILMGNTCKFKLLFTYLIGDFTGVMPNKWHMTSV